MGSSKQSSVKCVRDLREFPPASYRLPDDGRKWKALCDERRKIANHLATYANGDGTSITAGINRWVKETGIKRRTLFRRLDDLRKLGLLRDKHGLTGESGTARRSLDVSKLKMPGQEGVGVPDSVSDVPDSTDQKCQIDQAGVSDSTGEVPNRRGGVPKPPVFGTQPSFLPSTNRPSNRPQDFTGRLAGIHKESGKGKLSPVGGEQVLLLPETHGVDEGVVERAYKLWLAHRDMAGLKHPLAMFAKEFPEALVKVQAQEKRRANRVENARKIEDSVAAHKAWREKVEVLAEQSEINGYDVLRHPEKWEAELRTAANPIPAYLVETDEGLTDLCSVPEAVIANAIELSRLRAQEEFARATADII